MSGGSLTSDNRSEDSAIEVTLLGGTARPEEGEGDFFSMAAAALEGILEVCSAERGLVRIPDAAGDGERFITRDRFGASPPLASFAPGEVLMRQVRIEGKPGFECPETSETTTGAEGRLRSRAAVSVPICRHGRVIGLVYVERRRAAFPRQTLSVLAWFAQMLEAESHRQRRWRWRTVDVRRQLSGSVA